MERREKVEQYLLGIDVGTSGCKVAAFAADGRVVCSDTQNYEVYHPQTGWAEQEPDEWYAGVCAAIRNLIGTGKLKPEQVAGVGIDGQSWSAIPMDSAGNVLCRTPIWYDMRAQEICDELKRNMGNAIFELCGNPIAPSYSSPKVLWYKRHCAGVYEKAHRVLQANSFIVYRLTGVFSQDVCQGYGLHFFDMRKKQYDESMIRAMGLRTELFPEIYACHEVVGGVSDQAAAQTGLLVGTPVVAGGLDAACGALGAGVIDDGQVQEQGGQAGGMSIALTDYVADERLILSAHVVPEKYILQGGTVGGGGVMRWFEAQFGDYEREVAQRTGQSSFDLLTQEAERVAAGSGGMVFLPYMAGERSPLWDSHAKGVYYGIDYRKTKGHFMRAALEGTVFALRHNIEIAKNAGAEVGVLNAMGGSANSLFWTQLKADITGKDIIVPYADEATTLGAAILAGVGVGVYSDFYEARERTLKIRRRHTHNNADKEVYDQAYQTYLKLYQNLKDLMKEEANT